MLIGASVDMLVKVTEGMGRFAVKTRKLEGPILVDFAKRMEKAVFHTYFQWRKEHRPKYKSGSKSRQVDYILWRQNNLKEIGDCKVVTGESTAGQYGMVMCWMTPVVR